jgi:pimeloyl-ACP methyl ester carboxylesterase
MNAARAVTFVPGAAGAGSFWTPVVERLPTTWRTQALDLPGLGCVPARANVASYSDLVKYVAKKIDTPTALVGQSMGAFVALELALRYPLLKSHRGRSYARFKNPQGFARLLRVRRSLGRPSIRG